MPTATAVNWNVIYWIFQCKYQFECLSSLETIYVIFILWCTIFHFLLFLDSLCLCLCLLFSHVQCCNHSDQLWERIKVSWTTLLCSEDLEMEKLVTDSSATSTLSSNTPLPTSSYALVNPLSLPRTFFCICILYNGDIGQLVKIFRGVQSLAPKRFEIGGVSFRVISSPMNAAIRTRRRGSPDQNWLV